MSTQRPNLLDLRSQSQASVSRPLKSPRLHVAGEVPPDLSPLDAFALQSRLLAKQLEESAKAGRRVSRLPPLTMESPLVVQGRSEYFRSMSLDSGSDHDEAFTPQNTGLGLRTEVEESANRPMSMHPRMSRVPPTPDEAMPFPFQSGNDLTRGRQLDNIEEGGNFFGARREHSPTPIDTVHSPVKQTLSRSTTQDSARSQPSPLHSHPLTGSPEKALKKGSLDSMGGLAPPRPLFPKRSSSIMSSPLESTDEEGMSSLSNSFHSQLPRKLSTSSGIASPGLNPPYHRSPSISSDASAPLPRPSFNFSRPLSRAGTPGLDTPARQASSDSHASFVLQDDTVNTPVSMSSEGFPDHSYVDDGKSAAPSYIYSKFSLPRGKSLQRSAPMFPEIAPQALFSWEQPIIPPSNVQTFPLGGQAPPSPPTRPSSASGPKFLEDPMPRPSLEPSKLSMEILGPAPQPSPNPSRPSTDGGRSVEEIPRGRQRPIENSRSGEDSPRGRPTTAPAHEPVRGKTPMSMATSDSASTIKPSRSLYSIAPSATEISPDEHVTKAIALHEEGSLKESTYHLRLAARQGHPTGMLLYALACRHGWGMRPNQREGVEWLRKAAECASLEIADDEDQIKEGKAVNALERKTRKAQFALSIYELGVSHMNGWGIEQDRALALRCFEIAGSWGDVDALAEAGFCYAKGVGCKKDLKKSAKFYREAEAKGMSMVGNSWIHKSKYNEDDQKRPKSSKNRSKSRTRNIFGIRNKDSTKDAPKDP